MEHVIQSKDSTVKCCKNGGLFDISHMRGLSLADKDYVSFLERSVVADVASLHPGTGTLTVFTYEHGGALDDYVDTKVREDHVYLVVNVGCCDKELAHIGEHLEAFKAKGGDFSWQIHDERCLLALHVCSRNLMVVASRPGHLLRLCRSSVLNCFAYAVLP